MPGMGGHSCLEKINGIDPRKKVLVASGYMDERLMRSLLRQGACGFLEKPYDFQDLLRKVREVLDGS
jgi:FixJ family two-component response regulator